MQSSRVTLLSSVISRALSYSAEGWLVPSACGGREGRGGRGTSFSAAQEQRRARERACGTARPPSPHAHARAHLPRRGAHAALLNRALDCEYVKRARRGLGAAKAVDLGVLFGAVVAKHKPGGGGGGEVWRAGSALALPPRRRRPRAPTGICSRPPCRAPRPPQPPCRAQPAAMQGVGGGAPPAAHPPREGVARALLPGVPAPRPSPATRGSHSLDVILGQPVGRGGRSWWGGGAGGTRHSMHARAPRPAPLHARPRPAAGLTLSLCRSCGSRRETWWPRADAKRWAGCRPSLRRPPQPRG